MKRDKIIEYIFLIAICVTAFFNLFLLNGQIQKYILTGSILVITFALFKFFEFKKVNNMNKKRFVFLMSVFSVLYLIILYFLGIFVGFYRNANAQNVTQILLNVIPWILVIVCTELIRQMFILRGNKKSKVIITALIVVIEVAMYKNEYNILNLNKTLELIGYIIFSSIATNIFLDYSVKRYGIIPGIIYRFTTILYPYVFGYMPDIYMFIQSVYKIIYPYFMYIIIDNYFETKKFDKAVKNKKIAFASFILTAIVTASIVMLVSCKFRFGILVVGSYSMEGTIDKGDAVVYEKYTAQDLDEGQVIIFKKDNIKIIHKIEKVQIINGEKIYITKGTNNEEEDEGYRKDSDIFGVVKFKVVDIGWPTIFVNDLFKGIER